LEVPGDYEIVASDWSPQVIKIAKHNVARIGEAIRLLHRPLGAVLAEEQFDLIDLDAPGTPMPFLDMACQSLHTRKTEGHLLITATDMMVLAGAQPRACHRRYGAWPMQGEIGHEVAVRILLGAVVRANARYGRTTVPALSFVHGHWYGVYVRVAKDERRADAALEQLDYAILCPSCWERRVIRGEVQPTRCTHCGEEIRPAGPLWTGALWEPAILERMLADRRALALEKDVRAALTGWLRESSGPPLFYDIHAAAQRLGCKTPNVEELQQKLSVRGFRSARTHFAKIGLKTDTDARLVLELVRDCKLFSED
jgi:tRNA (guanine26-N2/guanine27-N2)-dimethyltransferase